MLEVSGTTIGVFVDAVTEVLRVPASSIEPLSALGSRAGATFIDGIAKVEGGLLSLLELDDALSADALRAFQAKHRPSSATSEANEANEQPLELPLPIQGVEAPEDTGAARGGLVLSRADARAELVVLGDLLADDVEEVVGAEVAEELEVLAQHLHGVPESRSAIAGTS